MRTINVVLILGIHVLQENVSRSPQKTFKTDQISLEGKACKWLPVQRIRGSLMKRINGKVAWPLLSFQQALLILLSKQFTLALVIVQRHSEVGKSGEANAESTVYNGVMQISPFCIHVILCQLERQNAEQRYVTCALPQHCSHHFEESIKSHRHLYCCSLALPSIQNMIPGKKKLPPGWEQELLHH